MRPRSRASDRQSPTEGAFQRWVWIRRWGSTIFPLTLYLVALPLRLWSDPLAAVLFTVC